MQAFVGSGMELYPEDGSVVRLKKGYAARGDGSIIDNAGDFTMDMDGVNPLSGGLKAYQTLYYFFAVSVSSTNVTHISYSTNPPDPSGTVNTLDLGTFLGFANSRLESVFIGSMWTGTDANDPWLKTQVSYLGDGRRMVWTPRTGQLVNDWTIVKTTSLASDSVDATTEFHQHATADLFLAFIRTRWNAAGTNSSLQVTPPQAHRAPAYTSEAVHWHGYFGSTSNNEHTMVWVPRSDAHVSEFSNTLGLAVSHTVSVGVAAYVENIGGPRVLAITPNFNGSP
jgi:hypothetical protein